ncbi:MAG: peptide chain release factor N(5)-glutamine methyltransferase [Candidatus Aminicenantes bacterium]|nr:peptide chain release factor N(5)-glutamine methyltransferase [Candidatus Aminicenantes bacterium]
MATIQELFQKGKSLLRDCPDPSLEAKILLLSAASIGEEQFFSSPDLRLSRKQERDYFQLVARRLAGLPIAYLSETKEFWSIPFRVLPGVLIPRPETELIVEKVLEFSSQNHETIVDVGTGCGNIAVSLAKELPEARIIATDTSAKALKVARLNASEQKVDHILFTRGNLFAPLKKLNLKRKCDFIVSNPPYVSENEWAELPQEIKGYEPKKALVAGYTGLEMLQKIIKDSRSFLKSEGYLILEIGENQRKEVNSFFNSGWKRVAFSKDLSGIPRVVTAQKI